MKRIEARQIEDESTSVTVTGKFTFEPLNKEELVSLISGSALTNKDRLLQALFWPKSDWKWEKCTIADNEKSGRNEMRGVSQHLHWALDQKLQGPKIRFEYCLFTHTETYYEESGYRQAIQFLTSEGYQCPKLMWFVSFVLRMSETCSKFSFATPIALDNTGQCLYPYYSSESYGQEVEDYKGTLWFDWNCGDVCADLDLSRLNHGLMFGVKGVALKTNDSPQMPHKLKEEKAI